MATLCAAGVAGTAQASAQQPRKVLHVAAAADLKPVMPAVSQAYEKKTGIRLEVSFGSSSVLATQILNGAPIDVFLGADFTFPEKVIAAGLADEKLPEPYATGTLVLWGRKDLPFKLSMDALKDPRVQRVAIANEFHAPYGRAAYSALRSLKVFDEVKGKLVIGENIGQTAQFVSSGNAQLGFLSLTLAESDAMKQQGQYVLVPMIYPQIKQCGVVLKHSPHLAEARQFMDWMRGPEVQSNLHSFGLEPVR